MRSFNVTTFNAGGGLLDGPTLFRTNAITVGALTAQRSVLSAISTPGVTSPLAVHFRTTGAIPMGGSIRVVLPEDGWNVLTSTPAVKFLSPRVNHVTEVHATCTYDQNSRALVLALTNSAIRREDTVHFTISGVRSPYSVRPPGIAVVSTFSALGS